MMKMLGLAHLPSDYFALLMFVILLSGMMMGWLTDAIMGDRGFGPFGNGFLIILGCFVGIYVRNAYFGNIQHDQITLTGIFAASSATLLLLILGVVKHWVQD
jgi:uncharacterized membrane protein YeaQ/YmgE (transglycosylase-associated protein family)